MASITTITITTNTTTTLHPALADLASTFASALEPVLATHLTTPLAATVRAGPSPWGPALVAAAVSTILAFGFGLVSRRWDKKEKNKDEDEDEDEDEEDEIETYNIMEFSTPGECANLATLVFISRSKDAPKRDGWVVAYVMRLDSVNGKLFNLSNAFA
ncbi:hypothetical protein Daus18300_009521 [Diaporthe australafricana]|uniref:Uncharacterized protein n=1 Tax=Diaporthe australafricana TaxID=127596 RepID=A0ABR3WDW5_9PEZI